MPFGQVYRFLVRNILRQCRGLVTRNVNGYHSCDSALSLFFTGAAQRDDQLTASFAASPCRIKDCAMPDPRSGKRTRATLYRPVQRLRDEVERPGWAKLRSKA